MVFENSSNLHLNQSSQEATIVGGRILLDNNRRSYYYTGIVKGEAI